MRIWNVMKWQSYIYVQYIFIYNKKYEVYYNTRVINYIIDNGKFFKVINLNGIYFYSYLWISCMKNKKFVITIISILAPNKFNDR